MVRPALLVGAAALFFSQAKAQDCKCTPSDRCWPTSNEWETLNTTLSGRLIRAAPPGAVCYPERPEYNATTCEAVIAGWSKSSWHSANPVSIPAPVMANDSCNPIYPNGTSVTGDVHAGARGCAIGMYPQYVVNATDASHIQAALRFAKDKNLRLTIKNTGHNGAGRNVGYGSLSIWTHNLKSSEFHRSFVPQGNCSRTGNITSQMAITLGAGTQDGEAFAAAAKNNAVTVGGTSMDVGVVGWATGGGHGTLTGQYGQGSDNILQAVLVTPAGDVITANKCQNTDIFWAIRGGGGGTFGVIVNLTMKAYPMPSMHMMGLTIAAKNATTTKQWYRLIADIHRLMPAAQDNGMSGYWTTGGSPNLNIAFSFFLYNKSNATAQTVQQPFVDLLHASNAAVTYTFTHFWTPSWYHLMSGLNVPESAGTTKSITASRFITRHTVLNNTDAFASTLEQVGPRKPGTLKKGLPNFSMSGTMTASRTPVDNALNPAWRDAVVHAISERNWDDSLPTAEEDAVVRDMTYTRLGLLRELEPASGCYLNEANVNEPGWQWSFFGPNYGRLRQVKDRYDPHGLLWCPQCVGSEDWVQTREGRLCKAYDPLESGR